MTETTPRFERRPLPENPWQRAFVNKVWRLYELASRTQWLSRDELEQQQLAAVRALLGAASIYTPYYRSLFADNQIVPESIRSFDDFRRVPILPRRTYQARAEAFTSDQLPIGMHYTGDKWTSGTTGIPVEIRQTDLVNQWWLALLLRDLQWARIDPCWRAASIRSWSNDGKTAPDDMPAEVSPIWGGPLNMIIQTGEMHSMQVSENPVRQLEWLLHVKPAHLTSYPSNLALLAACLEDSGKSIGSLKRIHSVSETLTTEDQEEIEKAFGVPVWNLYSCHEAGYLASPCPEGGCFHIHGESVLIEVVNDLGEPCGPGERGRVLLTTLQNYLTPLIRYEIGDEAVVGPPNCPCGRGLPTLSAVLGKLRPPFRLPGGAYRHSSPVADLLRDTVRPLQFQCEQIAVDHVVIRIVPREDWTDGRREELGGKLARFFGDGVRVDIDVLNRIPPLASGKCPAFIPLSDPIIVPGPDVQAG